MKWAVPSLLAPPPGFSPPRSSPTRFGLSGSRVDGYPHILKVLVARSLGCRRAGNSLTASLGPLARRGLGQRDRDTPARRVARFEEPRRPGLSVYHRAPESA